MKTQPFRIRRPLLATLAVAMLLPCSFVLSPSESVAGGVAVRGPRGGGAAVRTTPGRRAAAPAVRGTARRTTRRTMRRMTVLPRGYTTRVVRGATYYVVSGVYYKPYYEGTTVVYVEVEL